MVVYTQQKKRNATKCSILMRLGCLLVKMLICCAGGPVFDPWLENPTFSTNVHQQKSQRLGVIQMKQ